MQSIALIPCIKKGGPEGMAVYSKAMFSLIKRLRDHVKQFWFADDSAPGEKREQLKSWW